ncbi:MAG TPA: hypothetical protein VK886_11230 [Vicinamibacterales bacterium]|nr:hypothetical protein [Vicinamibacterales bacterium]
MQGHSRAQLVRWVDAEDRQFNALLDAALAGVSARGTCDLYDSRPVSCRTDGPPVRIGGQDLPPCRLCFTSAAPHEIERARVEIDNERVEEDLLAALQQAGAISQVTCVALALAANA